MPLNDVNMAQLRAEMLRRAEQSMYDDGASQLGQNPNMQPVSFIGRGPKPTKPVAPVDPFRRSLFGLPEAPIARPIVPVPPQQPAPTAPQPAVTPTAPQPAVTPAQPANPLGQLAQQALNAPVSRRQVLKRAGAAAIQSALPTPSAMDVAKEVMSPLAEAAITPTVMPNAYMTALAMLKDAMHYDFRSTPVNGKIAELEKYRAIADSTKIPEERLNEIDALIRHAKEVTALPYELYAKRQRNEITPEEYKREIHKHDELGRSLNGVVGDLIDATPADAFIQHVYKPSEDWRIFDSLTQSDFTTKEIKKLFKTLKIPFDAESFKSWRSGEHF